jgi:hypothetical protein
MRNAGVLRVSTSLKRIGERYGKKTILSFFISECLILFIKKIGMVESLLVDVTNKHNNVNSIKKLEEADKATQLLKLVTDYRTHVQMFEYMPTWDILEFLQKMEDEMTERYDKGIKTAEREAIRERYFLLTGKKPFTGWSNERMLEEIEKFQERNKSELKESSFKSKKSTLWNKKK